MSDLSTLRKSLEELLADLMIIDPILPNGRCFFCKHIIAGIIHFDNCVWLRAHHATGVDVPSKER